MKKSLISIITFILVLSLFPLQPITAHAASKDGFEYTVNADGATATITKYTGSNENITIPAVLDGYPVTTILTFSVNTVKNIVIQDGITKIDDSSLFYCALLESVIIPKSITYIGNSAFKSCPKLTSIQVAADSAYFYSEDGILFNKDKTQLYRYPPAKPGNYSIPDTVTKISSPAFEGCHNIISIYIPLSLSVYQYDPFENCDNLVEINVDSLNTKYSSLNGVLFNKDKTRLIRCPGGISGVYAVPETVTEIAAKAFWYCKKLTRIDLPEGLEEIEMNALGNCGGLTAIDIPDAVEVIPSGAFAGCTGLQSVTLPNDLLEIDDVAFSRCENLTGITIPDGVTVIGRRAFQQCVKLANITFTSGGNCLTSIGESAFLGCTNLRCAAFKGNAPTLGSSVFTGYMSGFKVYYLSGSTGFTNPWYGYATQEYGPVLTIDTSKYGIDRTQKYIKGVRAGTSVNDLKSNLTNSAANIAVYAPNNTECKSGYVGTGMSVRLMFGSYTTDQLQAVVPGDTSGDGQLTISDYVNIRLDILGLGKLANEYKEAGDINGDGKINVSDYTAIRLNILGLKAIG